MPQDNTKIQHGGARPGAGRPPVDTERFHVSLPPWAAALLRSLGNGSISKGILAALEKMKQHD